MQNADFRFCAQIRSHFLLHQVINHHRYFEGYPYFSPPSIGTLMVTHLGISHLFVTLQSFNHLGHFLRHPCFFLFLHRHTNRDTPWDIPTFSSLTFRDTFRYIPLFCQTNKRDTNYYIQPLKCKEPSLLSQIFILVCRKTL